MLTRRNSQRWCCGGSLRCRTGRSSTEGSEQLPTAKPDTSSCTRAAEAAVRTAGAGSPGGAEIMDPETNGDDKLIAHKISIHIHSLLIKQAFYEQLSSLIILC